MSRVALETTDSGRTTATTYTLEYSRIKNGEIVSAVERFDGEGAKARFNTLARAILASGGEITEAGRTSQVETWEEFTLSLVSKE